MLEIQHGSSRIFFKKESHNEWYISFYNIIWIVIQLPYFKFIRPRPSNLGRAHFQVGCPLYTPQCLQEVPIEYHTHQRCQSLDP